jgi:hypothetical protein
MIPVKFNKNLLFALTLAITSCQFPVGAKPAAPYTQRLKNIAQKYPTIYRVQWTVCGVQKRVSIGRTLLDQCVEAAPPMLVWAATGKYKLIPTHQYTGGIQSHLFVESRGCFAFQEPSKTPQFYKAETFMVGRYRNKDNLPTPTAQVKVTRLTDKEKEAIISHHLSTGSETFFLGISSNYNCQSEQKWREKFSNAIPSS